MLERLKRLKKDPFSLFIENQDRQNREVRFDGRARIKMAEKFGKKVPAFLGALNDALGSVQTGTVSLVANKEDPVIRFSFKDSQKPAKAVINVMNFPVTSPADFSSKMEELIRNSNLEEFLSGQERKAISTSEIKLTQTPAFPIETEKTEQEKKNVSRPMVLDISQNLKIYLPEIEGVQITVERDKKSPWIDLIKEDGKMLSVWQWKKGSSEIVVGKKDYKIEEDSLLEEDWRDGNKKEMRHPLARGEGGEITIDLTQIKGNKELREFLIP